MLICCFIFVAGLCGLHGYLGGCGLTHLAALLLWVGDVVRQVYKFGGRLSADSAGWSLAGSITGGEASQNLCSEKEGFTHPSLWRAPCFWGTYEWELHAVDT